MGTLVLVGSWWVRLLIAGSYFLFFEYTVLARTYALGVLFLWGFCALVGTRQHVEMRGSFLAAGGLLFLLAQTNVFATILTLAATLWLIADWLWSRESPREPVWKPGLAVGLALGGVALAAADMIPPPDSGFLPGWRLTWAPVVLAKSLGSLERAYLPFPQPGLSFWDTNGPRPLARDSRGSILRPVPTGFKELYRPGPAIVHEVWAVYRVSPTVDGRGPSTARILVGR